MYYENFEALCKAKNVKPANISKETGISKATFSAWKSGEYTPKIDKLAKIAEYFDVSIDYLTGNTENNVNPIFFVDESHSITDNPITSQELKNAFTFPEQDMVKISDEAKDIAVDFMNAPDDVKRAVRTLLKCYKLDL